MVVFSKENNPTDIIVSYCSKCCILLLANILIFFPSCEKNRIYERNIPIKKYSWDSEFIPSYTIDIRDTSVLYNFYVNVRHSEGYPYRNIWLLVTTQFPDETKIFKRIEVMLANDEGKWFGNGVGNIWDYSSLIQEDAFFNIPGSYNFSIEQNMRLDPLPGIMSIGVRIENTSFQKYAQANRL